MTEVKVKSKAKEIELPAGVTIEMVNAWKERYGKNKVKLATLSCDDNSFEPFNIVVRVPDRNTMGEFEKWLDRKPDKAKEILIKACVLSNNKDEVLVNDDKFLAAFNAIAEILPIQKAIIKNL